MKEMIWKKDGFWGDSKKTVSVGADVTSDGRLFQRRHPVNADEGKAGIVLFVGKTVWSMPERFVCTLVQKGAI